MQILPSSYFIYFMLYYFFYFFSFACYPFSSNFPSIIHNFPSIFITQSSEDVKILTNSIFLCRFSIKLFKLDFFIFTFFVCSLKSDFFYISFQYLIPLSINCRGTFPIICYKFNTSNSI